jgi:cytochrome P450
MRTVPFPPGPRGLPFLGSLRGMRREPLTFLTRVAADYGDRAHFRLGGLHAFLLSDPHDIEDVLVTHHQRFTKGPALQRARRLLGNGLLTSEGQSHRRQRRLAQPAFHRQRVAAYGGAMVELAVGCRERWRSGGTIDIAREMNRLTLAVVGRTLFGADVESQAAEIRQALTAAIELFDLTVSPVAALLEHLPTPRMRRFVRALAKLDRVVYGFIEARRSEARDSGDLLSMLLFAEDDEGDGSGMTDLQLRDETMTIFLAGHETTANALAWTWFLLIQHPEAEARLHAELDTVLHGRLPTFGDVVNLAFTRRVLAESMRLYPPVWTIGRRAIAEHPVGGYVVPVGSLVLVSQWVVHHDARWFRDPDRFDPDRWLPDRQAARPKFSYFPFGGGPRVCIGEAFAWMEGILLLATIAQRWRFSLASDALVALQPVITLRPRWGIKVTTEARHVERQAVDCS